MARALAVGIAVLGAAIGVAACGTGSSEPLDRAFGALDTPASTTTTTTAPPPRLRVVTHSELPAVRAAPRHRGAGGGSGDGPIIERGRLVVAVDENTEGLASRDSDGQLVGLEIDVAARDRGLDLR